MSADLAQHHVKLTVTGDCGNVLWEGFCRIDEKYPFWCDECDEYHRNDKYPWSITAEIVPAPTQGPEAELCQCGHIARVHNAVAVLGRRGYCHECSPGGCKSYTPVEAAAPELRVRIHQHLKQHPGLTAFELARALGVKTSKGDVGASKVRTALKAMEAEGEASREPGMSGTAQPANRWRAT